MKKLILFALLAGSLYGADTIIKYAEDESVLIGKIPVGEATQTALDAKVDKTDGTATNLTVSGDLTSADNSIVYETTVNSSNVVATTWYDATNQVMRITEVITAP